MERLRVDPHSPSFRLAEVYPVVIELLQRRAPNSNRTAVLNDVTNPIVLDVSPKHNIPFVITSLSNGSINFDTPSFANAYFCDALKARNSAISSFALAYFTLLYFVR